MQEIKADIYNTLLDELVTNLNNRGIIISKVTTVVKGNKINSTDYDSELINQQSNIAYTELPLPQSSLPISGSIILEEFINRLSQLSTDLYDNLACSNCVGVCTTTCAKACTSCSDICGGGCGGGRCGNGCNPMCITNVTFGCQSCENGCGGGCQSCTGTCDTGCYSYCSRNGCKTNCQSNCQNSCSSDCANSSRYGVYKYHN